MIVSLCLTLFTYYIHLSSYSKTSCEQFEVKLDESTFAIEPLFYIYEMNPLCSLIPERNCYGSDKGFARY